MGTIEFVGQEKEPLAEACLRAAEKKLPPEKCESGPLPIAPGTAGPFGAIETVTALIKSKVYLAAPL